MPAYDKYLKDSAAPAPAGPAYAKYLETPQAAPAREEVEVGNAYSKALGYGNKYTGNPEQVAAYKKEQEAHPIKTFLGLGRAPEELGLSGPAEGMKTWRDPVSDYYKTVAKTGIALGADTAAPIIGAGPAMAGTAATEAFWNKTGAGVDGETAGEAAVRGAKEGAIANLMRPITAVGGMALRGPVGKVLGSKAGSIAGHVGEAAAPVLFTAGTEGRLPTVTEAATSALFQGGQAKFGGMPAKAPAPPKAPGRLSSIGDVLQKPEKGFRFRAEEQKANIPIKAGEAEEASALTGLSDYDRRIAEKKAAAAEVKHGAMGAKREKVAAGAAVAEEAANVAEEQLKWNDALQEAAQKGKATAGEKMKAGLKVAFEAAGIKESPAKVAPAAAQAPGRAGPQLNRGAFENPAEVVPYDAYTAKFLRSEDGREVSALINNRLGANAVPNPDIATNSIEYRREHGTRYVREHGAPKAKEDAALLAQDLSAWFLGHPKYNTQMDPVAKQAMSRVAAGVGTADDFRLASTTINTELAGKWMPEELIGARRGLKGAQAEHKRAASNLANEGISGATMDVEEERLLRDASPEMKRLIEARLNLRGPRDTLKEIQARKAAAGITDISPIEQGMRAAGSTTAGALAGAPFGLVGAGLGAAAGAFGKPIVERAGAKAAHAAGSILKALDTAPPGVQSAMEPFRRAAPRGADAARAALYLLAQQNPEVRAWLREHRQQSQGE